MEIIEKQVEKTKEVPYGYWENCGYGGYGRNVNGKANAGLTLGIIGTVLGGAALLGRRNGFSLFGNSGTGTSGSDANIAIASCGGVGSGYGYAAPTAFQAWEKSCEDTLALQKGLYDWALTQQSQRDADDSIRQELSDLKAQVAINAAIRPYQDKLIQCEIDKAFTAGINYTDRKTCKMIEGQVVLPNTPTVTGFGSYCSCKCLR